MPQNEKWGEQGWSYRDKEDAEAKFRQKADEIDEKNRACYDYPESSKAFHASKSEELPSMTPLRNGNFRLIYHASPI